MVDCYGSPELYSKKMKTARKCHRCNECYRTILPKERYEYFAGKWDGVFETYKTCPTCLDIRNAFFCEGWNFGEVMEDFKEHVADMGGDISEDCIVELSPPARDKVCGLIEQYWY